MRKWYLVAAGAIVVAAALVGGAWLGVPGREQSTPEPTATPEPPAPITAKGTIQPVRQSKLGFRTVGQIALLPKVGDRVEEGQEIARLDTSEIYLAIVQAEDAVAINQAQIEQVEAPARPVDLAALQAAHDGALARHNQLLVGPTAAELRAAAVAVSSAEAGVQAARTRLKQLKAGPSAAELAAAESASVNARAALAAARQRQETLDATSAPRAAEIRAAELALEVAKNNLWAAQVDRDATRGLYGADAPQSRAADARVAAGETAVAQARAALEARQVTPTDAERRAVAAAVDGAQAELNAAQARVDQLKAGPTAADLEAAESNARGAESALATAKARLDQLQAGATPGDKEASAAAVAQAGAALELRKAGPAPVDLSVLKARLKQSQTALDQARAARRSAVIISPLSGVVVWTSGNVGETAAPGTPIVVVADLTQLQVETTDLDEASATQVDVGQPVAVRVNAFPDKVLEGTVKSIALLATATPSGDANYTVTIALARLDPALRLGMTTRVEFGVGR
ncbi:MAG: efflux RND transporter periplasmic adaptor subunit [Chloroflexi bacterium]|nr:efflux RND transporter periplasmic adaptor subunit [Chloroflexota bacterium]